MPKYNKKITSPMDYDDFAEKIRDLPRDRQALLSILFFTGCRISEALALTSNDIDFRLDTFYVQIHRLKGSMQTDPLPLPRTSYLMWLTTQDGRLFKFSYKTAYRIVKRIWPDLYPHYFRHNRFTNLAEKFPLATLISYTGLTPNAVKFYIAKVDIKRVGKALLEELG